MRARTDSRYVLSAMASTRWSIAGTVACAERLRTQGVERYERPMGERRGSRIGLVAALAAALSFLPAPPAEAAPTRKATQAEAKPRRNAAPAPALSRPKK